MAEETSSEYTWQNAAQRKCAPKKHSHVEHQVTTVGEHKASEVVLKYLATDPLATNQSLKCRNKDRSNKGNVTYSFGI